MLTSYLGFLIGQNTQPKNKPCGLQLPTNVFFLLISLSWLMFVTSGEGCSSKKADAGQDRDASVNQSSPVIGAFRGNFFLRVWVHIFNIDALCSVKNWSVFV